ncbi:MAG: hypothetical protein PWP57_857, partial [Candidatus Atribacteria bacterium]|nr:hypothetical protein [Candidatus Atribacteria bacterium]
MFLLQKTTVISWTFDLGDVEKAFCARF